MWVNGNDLLGCLLLLDVSLSSPCLIPDLHNESFRSFLGPGMLNNHLASSSSFQGALRISRQVYMQVVVIIVYCIIQIAALTRGARPALAHPILHFSIFYSRGARQDLAYPKITHHQASGCQ